MRKLMPRYELCQLREPCGTRLVPQHYEPQLLAQHERGELALDEVEQLLATSVYQLAYRILLMDDPSLHVLLRVVGAAARLSPAA